MKLPSSKKVVFSEDRLCKECCSNNLIKREKCVINKFGLLYISNFFAVILFLFTIWLHIVPLSSIDFVYVNAPIEGIYSITPIPNSQVEGLCIGKILLVVSQSYRDRYTAFVWNKCSQPGLNRRLLAQQPLLQSIVLQRPLPLIYRY